jgi:flagellar biosynthesis/type III secretory pathway protein FliH
MAPDDVRPFLTQLAKASAPRGLDSALPAIPTPEAISPWAPKTNGAAATPMQLRDVQAEQAELEATRDDAIESGRLEGMRQTEQIRARLAALIGELELARTSLVPPAADLIADAATAVVTAWIERSDRRDLFAPVVRGWIARCMEPSTARVHPDDVAAMREAIGEGRSIAVVGDDTIARGDVRIRGGALEVSHAWEPRLRELREAIATAIDDSGSR